MNSVSILSMLAVAELALSACVPAGPSGGAVAGAGLPSDAEWNVMLLTSAPAYNMASASGSISTPTEAVWNAVLEEDRQEMKRGFASGAQLQLDIEIGQLLQEARKATALHDDPKLRDVGAKLQAGLNRRMKIVRDIADDYSRQHPFKLTLVAPACANPNDPMACARPPRPMSQPAQGLHVCPDGVGLVGTGPSGEPLCN